MPHKRLFRPYTSLDGAYTFAFANRSAVDHNHNHPWLLIEGNKRKVRTVDARLPAPHVM